jgi:hypothetical protein
VALPTPTDEHRAMPTSRPVRLGIELRAADQRVTGRLTDERGGRHRFGNWLDLLTLLEAARLRSLAPDGSRAQPQPSARRGRGAT